MPECDIYCIGHSIHFTVMGVTDIQPGRLLYLASTATGWYTVTLLQYIYSTLLQVEILYRLVYIVTIKLGTEGKVLRQMSAQDKIIMFLYLIWMIWNW